MTHALLVQLARSLAHHELDRDSRRRAGACVCGARHSPIRRLLGRRVHQLLPVRVGVLRGPPVHGFGAERVLCRHGGIRLLAMAPCRPGRRALTSGAGRCRSNALAAAAILVLSAVNWYFLQPLHAGRISLRRLHGFLGGRVRHLPGRAQGVRELALVADHRRGERVPVFRQGLVFDGAACSRSISCSS